MSSEERDQRTRKEPSGKSDTEEHPTNSDTDGKLHIRQLTHDECFEMVHNGGRLLSEEYRCKYFPFATKNRHQHLAFQTWNFRSDEKEIVAKSYIGVMHFIKFFKLNYKSVDDLFLSKFQSQIQHLVAPEEREWYSIERCRR